MADPTYLTPIDVNHNGKPVDCVVLVNDVPAATKHLIVWDQLSKFDQLQLTNKITNEFSGDPANITSLDDLDDKDFPLPVNGQTFLATYQRLIIAHKATIEVQGDVIDKNAIYHDGVGWKYVYDNSAVV